MARSRETLKFLWATTADARVVKFCTQVGYVKSHHKNDKTPLKEAWSESRDPF